MQLPRRTRANVLAARTAARWATPVTILANASVPRSHQGRLSDLLWIIVAASPKRCVQSALTWGLVSLTTE